MNELLTAALGYSRRGWWVFPLHGVVNGICTCGRSDCSSPGKHPLTRHGSRDATTKADVIRGWWGRWCQANIAIATGAPSGIIVVDVDLPRAFESLDVVIHKLPRTLTGLTGGGGLHLITRARQGQRLRNHTSVLPGIGYQLPGIDLRADGGHIVAPPSRHISGNRYTWLDADTAIADAPEWLREPPRRIVPIAPAAVAFTGYGTALGLKVLSEQLDILRHAKVGERNHTLNRCAFIVARYVVAGHMLESAARCALSSVALSIGSSAWESERTIESAFQAVFLVSQSVG